MSHLVNSIFIFIMLVFLVGFCTCGYVLYDASKSYLNKLTGIIMFSTCCIVGFSVFFLAIYDMFIK